MLTSIFLSVYLPGYQYEASPRCLNHSFTVHTKYELSPPYPAFCPRVFLKVDSVVIINTGDSLIAMSVDIEDHHGGFSLGLYSPRLCKTLSTLSSIGSEDQVSLDSHDNRAPDTAREHLDLLGKFVASSPGSGMAVYACRSPPTPKDATNSSSIENRVFNKQTSVQGKENQIGDSVLFRAAGSPPASTSTTELNQSTSHTDPVSNIPSISTDVYNFDDRSPPPLTRDEDSALVESDTLRLSAGYSNRKGSPSQRLYKRQWHINTHEAQVTHVASAVPDKVDGETSPFERPTLLPSRHSKDSCLSPTRSFSGLTLLSPLTPEGGYRSLQSPGVKLETGSTCSSCISTPIIVQSDSQCFTYSVRRYVEPCTLPDAPVDVEGISSKCMLFVFNCFACLRTGEPPTS